MHLVYHLRTIYNNISKTKLRIDFVSNNIVICKTFLLPSDVGNICQKQAKELWRKHLLNSISIQMKTIENPYNIFYYQEHSLMNLNSQPQEYLLFTLGFQNEWQLKMISKFSHNNVLTIATFASAFKVTWSFLFLARVTSANLSHSAMLMVSSSYRGPYSSKDGNQPSYFALGTHPSIGKQFLDVNFHPWKFNLMLIITLSE